MTPVTARALGLDAEGSTTGGRALGSRTLSEVRRELKLLPVDRGVVFGYRRAGKSAEASVVPRHLIPE